MNITNEELITTFLVTVEALKEQIEEGNITVYDFYEEIVLLKEFIVNNKK